VDHLRASFPAMIAPTINAQTHSGGPSIGSIPFNGTYDLSFWPCLDQDLSVIKLSPFFDEAHRLYHGNQHSKYYRAKRMEYRVISFIMGICYGRACKLQLRKDQGLAGVFR
jgi:hypothetical protein